jgi:hypothetical protein
MSQHNGLPQHGSAFVYSYPDQENSTGILMLFPILADILMGLMLLGLSGRRGLWHGLAFRRAGGGGDHGCNASTKALMTSSLGMNALCYDSGSIFV